MTLVVGTVTWVIAVFVTFCTKTLLNLKLTPVYTALHVAGGAGVSFFFLAGVGSSFRSTTLTSRPTQETLT